MRPSLVFTVLLLAAGVAGSSAVRAQGPAEVRVPEHRLRYRVPEGWLPVLEEELAPLNDRAAEAAASTGAAPTRFLFGFTREPGGRLALPYVLLSLEPSGVQQQPVEEVAERFGTVGEPLRTPANLDTFRALEARGPLLDVDKMRVLAGHHSRGDGQPRQVVSAYLLGKDRVLGVHCNVDPASIERTLPLCVSFLDGVSLDPEKVWTPIGGTGAFVGVARAALQVALLGGSIALGLAVLLMRRRRQRQEASRDDAAIE